MAKQAIKEEVTNGTPGRQGHFQATGQEDRRIGDQSAVGQEAACSIE